MQPAASSQQPAASSQLPAASFQLPAASSQQPAASSQQPAASSRQPATSSQQPAASSQQLAASNQQPATSSQQPAASSRQVGLSPDGVLLWDLTKLLHRPYVQSCGSVQQVHFDIILQIPFHPSVCLSPHPRLFYLAAARSVWRYCRCSASCTLVVSMVMIPLPMTPYYDGPSYDALI